jgi:cell division protein FtsA
VSQGSLIVACDFGTTIFRALVAEVYPGGKLEVVGAASEAAEGFQDGDFVDLRAGSEAVQRCLRRLEREAELEIDACSYNVSGPHLRLVSARSQVQVAPTPRPIRDGDVGRVLAKARSLKIPFDHQILAVNPLAYTVDKVGGIVDPRGRIGSQLEVDAHLITGSRSVVRNIETAIRQAGYAPAGPAVDVLAAAASLVTPGEKDGGILLIDIGGSATNWAALAGGRLLGVGSVPWGGLHLTRDLAHGLRVDQATAERIKCERGVVMRSLVAPVALDTLFEDEHPQETPGLVAAILEPRFEEILSLVKSHLTADCPLSDFGEGVLLTGGGARCRGSREVCEEVFGLKAHLRHAPDGLRGADRLPDGQWATALGLAMWGVLQADDTAARADQGDGEGGIQRLGRWLRRRRA